MSLTTEDLSAIKALFDAQLDSLTLQIGEGFSEVAENFADVRTDIAELKTDVTLLKNEMVDVKSDIVLIKSDISELKLDMREVKWGFADTVRRSEFLDVRDRVTRLEHQSDHN